MHGCRSALSAAAVGFWAGEKPEATQAIRGGRRTVSVVASGRWLMYGRWTIAVQWRLAAGTERHNRSVYDASAAVSACMSLQIWSLPPECADMQSG